jgi:hypothetical protein
MPDKMNVPYYEAEANEADTLGRVTDSERPAGPVSSLISPSQEGGIMHNADRNDLAHIGVDQPQYD